MTIEKSLWDLYMLIYSKERRLEEVKQDVDALRRSVKLLEAEEFGIG